MFNTISPHYDSINRLMTFGMDIIWRQAMINRIPRPCNKLLDLAAGTMDVSITAAIKRPDIKSIAAYDMAEHMLDIGQRKYKKKGLKTIMTHVGDVHYLTFPNNHFDAITIAFGIRNFHDLWTAIKEIERVLKPGGHLIILETCQPKHQWVRWLNNIYLALWVKTISGLISGKKDAYGYLSESIKTFYTPDELKVILSKSGFSSVNIQFFSFQSIQLIHAIK